MSKAYIWYDLCQECLVISSSKTLKSRTIYMEWPPGFDAATSIIAYQFEYIGEL